LWSWIEVRNMIQSVTYFSSIIYIKSKNICMKLILIIMSFSGENLVLIPYATLKSAGIFRTKACVRMPALFLSIMCLLEGNSQLEKSRRRKFLRFADIVFEVWIV